MQVEGNFLGFVIADQSPLGVRREDELDLATAPGYQLFFSCFFGNMQLRIDGLDFSTVPGSHAVLTFAMELAWRLDELPRTRRSTLESQEGSGWLSLLADRGRVYVSTSYREGIAVIEYEEFNRLATDALSDLLRRLVTSYPSLAGNPALRKALESMGLLPLLPGSS